jgi:alkanesulfonate monooxygenase SsuD/methylene tetrahydromethanopterin reductase-like flavin-dependent oxidoreductase (luciferase family)
MKYGFVLPFGDARLAADIAYDAEAAGWDGFFVWEPVWGIDAWISLAAAAMRTEKIRLGTMLTPVSRMRPWKLASETVTLDLLSNGRTILSVGLGALDTGFAAFGEETDRKIRAELLDEGLEILSGLWKGQPFSYEGKHYKVMPTDFFPPPSPVQQPRIPVWVVGAWPHPKSMQRVLRWDGLLPYLPGKELTPAIVQDMRAYVEDNRQLDTPFDIVVEGVTPGDNQERAADIVQPWMEAGASWRIEAMWGQPGETKELTLIRERVSQGPPKSI